MDSPRHAAWCVDRAYDVVSAVRAVVSDLVKYEVAFCDEFLSCSVLRFASGFAVHFEFAVNVPRWNPVSYVHSSFHELF